MTTASAQFTQDELGFNVRSLPVPATVAALVAGFALVAGLIVGPGGNGFIGGALSYSSGSSGFVGHLGSLLPPGFAFADRLVRTVNPCCFCMCAVVVPRFLAH